MHPPKFHETISFVNNRRYAVNKTLIFYYQLYGVEKKTHSNIPLED